MYIYIHAYAYVHVAACTRHMTCIVHNARSEQHPNLLFFRAL